MNVSNIPTVVHVTFEDGAAGGPPPISYEGLLEERRVAPGSVAMSLAMTHGGVGWKDALSVTKAAVADEDASAAHVRWMVSKAADAVAPRYWLVVTGGLVNVLYGWQACRVMDVNGQRFAGLIGDWSGRVGGGLRLPPKLHMTHPDVANQQYHAFNRAKATVGTFSMLQALFKNDGGMALAPLGAAPPVVEGKDAEDGTGPEATSIWKALPVHPKVAALFVGGVPV